MIATEKFRPEMGFKFISYAVWWIRKAILEYLSKNGRMIRIPANKLNNLSKFDKKVKELEQKRGRSVGLQEVINEFGGELGKENIDFLSVLSTYRTDSLDQEINHDDGDFTPLSDIIADVDTYKPADYFMMKENTKTEIGAIIDTLRPRDKRIMIGLFGLDGNMSMSLKEVGDEVGISREMVRQVKEKVLKNLKHKLRNSDVRDYD
jgi:RNA polymerase primary sigma factor